MGGIGDSLYSLVRRVFQSASCLEASGGSTGCDSGSLYLFLKLHRGRGLISGFEGATDDVISAEVGRGCPSAC
jgi:hypothetical protein